ncbi:DUF998 domain-containing protein [Streptomyces sp. NPDC020096]
MEPETDERTSMASSPHRRRRPGHCPAPAPATAVPLLLGSVAYTASVLEVGLATGLDPPRDYLSELAADQPLCGLFRATDLLAGLAVLPGSASALPLLPRRRWSTAGWTALAVFGAATAVASRPPLSCAPARDESCAARETAGLVPATLPHSLEGMGGAPFARAVRDPAAMLAALTAPVALTHAARRCGGWPPPHRAGPPLVLAELAATVWTLSAAAAFRAGRGTWSLGAGQRLQILPVAVWIGTLAVCVARHPAPDGTADGRQVRHAAQSPQVRSPARPMPPREGCHPKPPP